MQRVTKECQLTEAPAEIKVLSDEITIEHQYFELVKLPQIQVLMINFQIR